jgi:hypothetical protein
MFLWIFYLPPIKMVDKLAFFFATYEQAVTAEPRVQSRMTCEIGDGRSALEQVYSTSFFEFPALIFLPTLRTNPSLPPKMCDIYNRAVNYHILCS